MSKGPMSDEQKEIRRIAANKNAKKHSELMINYWKERKAKAKENSFEKYCKNHNIK